jgi:hypothetical protein
MAEFARATIVPAGGTPIDVLFNPNRYSLDEGNSIAELGIPGRGAPVLQYVRGNARSLSLELFFDVWEPQVVGGETIDNVTRLTDQIYALLAIDGNVHVPPVCDFVWGSFRFTCIVEHVRGQFTLFREDGTPVRATLAVNLKEYVDPKDQVRKDKPSSPDHVKTRIVRSGDTLESIAAAEYGDPAKWRPIADANAIANPRLLDAGRTLVIPAIT